jgi:hypothetical protein
LEKKQSYLYGISQGIEQKLNESKKLTEQVKFEEIKQNKGDEESQKAQSCYALTVKNDKEKLKTALEDFYPNLKSSSSRNWNCHSHDAISDGRKAGYNVSLNRPIENSNRAQIS